MLLKNGGMLKGVFNIFLRDLEIISCVCIKNVMEDNFSVSNKNHKVSCD